MRDPEGPTAAEEAALLEELVLNASTTEAAARYHERLDRVREELPPEPRTRRDTSDYRRGYQAGFEAGRRAPSASATDEGVCLRHRMVGFISAVPGCAACRAAALRSNRARPAAPVALDVERAEADR